MKRTAMRTIELPGGGKLPVLGLGTWELSGRRCVDVVGRALELGYRHVDTAEMYANEGAVGQALAASGLDRREVFLTSKVWTSHFRAADVPRTAERSLRLLRTDYLDLLLMHWPNPEVPLRETLEALAGLLEAGKVRAIGISNFPPELLRQALDASPAPIACDQVRYHVGHDQEELRRAARAAGVAVTAYWPLRHGGLLGEAALAEIGRNHGKSPAQVAIRWLIEHEGVATIPKASSDAHLTANLEVFDFELSGEERRRLASL
jgi:2,5-diketo-D-gluconate reductase B